MSNGWLSIVVFALLLLLNAVVPLGFAILAARSNFRHRRSTPDERKFWFATLGYLVIPVLLGLAEFELRLHPEPEGYDALFVAFFLIVITLPGSVASVLVTFLVARFIYVEPVFLPSFTDWFIVGVLCWTLFNATGLRWLIQTRRRVHAHPTAGSTSTLPAR